MKLKILVMLVIASMLVGCGSNQTAGNSNGPDFSEVSAKPTPVTIPGEKVSVVCKGVVEALCLHNSAAVVKQYRDEMSKAGLNTDFPVVITLDFYTGGDGAESVIYHVKGRDGQHPNFKEIGFTLVGASGGKTGFDTLFSSTTLRSELNGITRRKRRG